MMRTITYLNNRLNPPKKCCTATSRDLMGSICCRRVRPLPLRRRATVARMIYRIHNRPLLRFLWWSFGPLVGWLAEHSLVGK
jgi:hypothetical protein